MDSGNPALKPSTLGTFVTADEHVATVGGVSFKTFVYLALLAFFGVMGWDAATSEIQVQTPDGATYAATTVTIPGWWWLTLIGTLVVGFLAVINPKRAAFWGAMYAALQGLMLGALSRLYEASAGGIVLAAVLGTVCVFTIALFLYATGIVKVTQKMAFGVTAGIAGLLFFYLVVWLLSLASQGVRDWAEFSTAALVVNLIAIALAAAALTLDFNSIDDAVAHRAPKWTEWYLAFGLMVTLIWLYLLILRLIARLNR